MELNFAPCHKPSFTFFEFFEQLVFKINKVLSFSLLLSKFRNFWLATALRLKFINFWWVFPPHVLSIDNMVIHMFFFFSKRESRLQDLINRLVNEDLSSKFFSFVFSYIVFAKAIYSWLLKLFYGSGSGHFILMLFLCQRFIRVNGLNFWTSCFFPALRQFRIRVIVWPVSWHHWIESPFAICCCS